ncbi:MAG: hypothetical protein QOI95_1415 [Acidimicrobiaceae bacterium]|jgi:putative membrane protein
MLSNHHHSLLRVVIAMLVIAALAALVAYLVVRFVNRRTPPTAVGAPSSPPVHDVALEQLRLRYARGEVSRTDYLQAATDLATAPSP